MSAYYERFFTFGCIFKPDLPINLPGWTQRKGGRPPSRVAAVWRKVFHSCCWSKWRQRVPFSFLVLALSQSLLFIIYLNMAGMLSLRLARWKPRKSSSAVPLTRRFTSLISRALTTPFWMNSRSDQLPLSPCCPTYAGHNSLPILQVSNSLPCLLESPAFIDGYFYL
jgi:hypothetical protein